MFSRSGQKENTTQKLVIAMDNPGEDESPDSASGRTDTEVDNMEQDDALHPASGTPVTITGREASQTQSELSESPPSHSESSQEDVAEKVTQEDEEESESGVDGQSDFSEDITCLIADSIHGADGVETQTCLPHSILKHQTQDDREPIPAFVMDNVCMKTG
ncbi:uncharacterized protein LOC106174498 [Lingula anatina]|uniref:Uncharacterized protein LOC106174498 n=1 Tax=Lingula anatina TaxID=7574 RepID=A0A1S3JNJ0_LINAN|nr:uncharacterized protein LOC106174498 [Lingula anatina]|eukprot:XP_013411534.1 uncharacterized protein LOC106174498 [Lingula anatina]